MPVIALLSSAWAVDLVIDLDADAPAEAAALTGDLDAVAANQLKLDALGPFLADMADAGSISTKGMGVDYAASMDKFGVGGSIGTGVSGVGLTFGNGDGDLPEGGVATQVTLMAGLNLGLLSGGDGVWKHLRLFANGLYAPLPSGTPFDGTMYNVGAHFQVGGIGQIASRGAISRGGIDLTGGVERTDYRLGLGESLPVDSGSGLKWQADGRFDVEVTADSVPLELSTSFRVLVVTAWVGGAVDLVDSVAVADASLQGPISYKKADVGTATVSLGEDGAGAASRVRLFAGTQVAVWLIHAYGQLNVGLDDTYGGHLGLRVMM
jgi:hypothetical protein